MRRYMQLAYLFHKRAKSLLIRDSRIANCTVRHPGVERPFSSYKNKFNRLCQEPLFSVPFTDSLPRASVVAPKGRSGGDTDELSIMQAQLSKQRVDTNDLNEETRHRHHKQALDKQVRGVGRIGCDFIIIC